MLRITKESEYAFLLLSALVDEDSNPKSATVLAAKTGVALPITGKVLKRLVKGGVLHSIRGAHGGYQLAKSAVDISVLSVLNSIEGTPEMVDCALHDIDCSFSSQCKISPFWQRLNREITQMMANKNLEGMRKQEQPLYSISKKSKETTPAKLLS